MHFKCKRTLILKENLESKMTLNMRRKEYIFRAFHGDFVFSLTFSWRFGVAERLAENKILTLKITNYLKYHKKIYYL